MQDTMLKLYCSAHNALYERMYEIKNERGATAVEYGIMVALIAAVIIATVKITGDKTNKAFEDVNKVLPG
jgi:pilus assembly protein Flp/PilA